MAMTKTQMKHLRGLGHKLKPHCYLGRSGLSESVMDQIKFDLKKHELVKVSIDAISKEEFKEAYERILSQTKSTLVSATGRNVVLFLANKTGVGLKKGAKPMSLPSSPFRSMQF